MKMEKNLCFYNYFELRAIKVTNESSPTRKHEVNKGLQVLKSKSMNKYTGS